MPSRKSDFMLNTHESAEFVPVKTLMYTRYNEDEYMVRRRMASSSPIGKYLLTAIPKRKRNEEIINGCDDSSKRRRLDSRIEALKSRGSSIATSLNNTVPPSPQANSEQPSAQPGKTLPKESPAKAAATRRTEPNQADLDLCLAWKKALPTLIDDILHYYSSSRGNPLADAGESLWGACPKECGKPVTSEVTALFFGHFKTLQVHHCSCRSLIQTLTRVGLFPSAPTKPRTAFSIDLLKFYSALFERSCNAVTAFTSATDAFYADREFFFKNKEGERMLEPFRRGFGYASQWLDALHAMVKEKIDHVLSQADQHLVRHLNQNPTNEGIPHPSAECTRRLRNLCPACFGLADFGRSFAEGSDIHVSTDGCFQHKHLVSAGQGTSTHHPPEVLSKEFVDSIGEKIDKARKSPPRRRQPRVPDEAVDQCQNSFQAAHGDQKRKLPTDSRFDSVGWMAISCRHDTPLVLANIDTPGEQQKYAVALLVWLFLQLPPNATVTMLYDIGCVLDRSIELYDILSPDLSSRLQLSISVMHAYGHQWACQLVYNPRYMKGLGLTDGECLERIWSKLCILISIVRISSHHKRITLTAKQVAYIASEVRTTLGDWISRRYGTGVLEQGSKAQVVLDTCGVALETLHKEWCAQKEAQLSRGPYTPESIRKSLEEFFSVQAKVATVENAIQATKSAPQEGTSIMKNLSAAYAEHTRSATKIRATCRSLLEAHFPQLYNMDLVFVRTLLLARDLKVDIRKRVTERFFEWARLDSTKGGKRGQPGTKLDKQTKQGLSKRRTALSVKIKQYNEFCDKLRTTRHPSYDIPLPEPLSNNLAELRELPDLMQDVWVSSTVDTPPLWLTSQEIRNGIQAMHRAERCSEENARLEMETKNMCRWFSRELAAVDLALASIGDSSLSHKLQQHRFSLMDIKNRWTHSLRNLYGFDSEMAIATTTTEQALLHLRIPCEFDL